MCFPAPVLHNYPGRVADKSTEERNSFNALSRQSVHIAYCSSADLCAKSPVGAVMDESVAERGAHSAAYCLTATVSIWLRLFLPRGASDRWATRGSFPRTAPDALPQRQSRTASQTSRGKTAQVVPTSRCLPSGKAHAQGCDPNHLLTSRTKESTGGETPTLCPFHSLSNLMPSSGPHLELNKQWRGC